MKSIDDAREIIKKFIGRDLRLAEDRSRPAHPATDVGDVGDVTWDMGEIIHTEWPIIY